MTPLYCILVHHPVRDRAGETVTTSVTNLDIHDIARSCRTFGVARYFISTPIEAQRTLVSRILEHWDTGAGATRVPERADALSHVEVVSSLEEAVARIEGREGRSPRVLVTGARPAPGAALRTLEEERAYLGEGATPTLLVFGTGHGLAQSLVDAADAILEPITGPSNYNHLSVRAAVAITLDRLRSK
ncbi:MAG: RNA methyltransferase [Myxococcales bacterium]|nr:RNA methyltransferase [Myxococcales bacterium]